MKGLAGFISILMVVLGGVSAFSADAPFQVTYLSAEYVYLDGGAENGLQTGDTLMVVGRQDDSILVEVVFTAGHSASARKVSGKSNPVTGDRLAIFSRARDKEKPAIATGIVSGAGDVTDEIKQAESRLGSSSPASPTIKGSFSLGFYHWSDRSPANLDFSQTSSRLNLRVHRLWNDHITFAIRSRGRYENRARAFSTIGRASWENRLWEFSLTYDNKNEGIFMAAGRVLPRRMAATGYLDGAVIEYGLSQSFRVGFLGGSQPDWLYGDPGVSLNRVGGYFSLISSGEGLLSYEQTIAGIGEAHAEKINRSFVSLSGKFSYGSRWGVNHTMEIDINTGWRKTRADDKISLSRAYLYGYYRLGRSLRAGLSYDNLKRYWTYEYITLADSLFDNRTRQGVRLRIDWTASGLWFLSGSLGRRDNSGETDPTISYSANLRRSKFPLAAATMALSFYAFDGPHESGLNYSFRCQMSTAKFGLIHIGYGRYQYAVDEINENRSSWYLETGLDADLGAAYYLGLSGQYNSGADIDGWRFQTELGFRF